MKPLSPKYKKLLKDFSKTVKLPRTKPPHLFVIAPFGPCCIGKTTTMTLLAKKIPIVHLNHDRMRLFMIRHGYKERVNEILYKNLLIVHCTMRFLRKGYSVIADRDFGTNNRNILSAMRNETKRIHVPLFLIGITAPRKFIVKKIMTRKLIPVRSGGIPDRETAMRCYRYSMTHYRSNYAYLRNDAVGIVDTSKPLLPQVIEVVSALPLSSEK